MNKCDCGCGNETGSPEFYKLHVIGGDLAQYETALLDNERENTPETNQRYESLKAKIEGKIEKANAVASGLHHYYKDLESQVVSYKYAEELKDREIAKLKEELVNQDNRVRLHFTAHQTTKRQLEQLKSALDKIDKLFSSWLDGNTNLGNFCTEYKELTKHKENK